MEKKIINYRCTAEYLALICDVGAALVEEAKTRVSNSREEQERRLRARHALGVEIVQHPAFSKYAKGNSAFVDNLRTDTKREIGDKIDKVIGKSSLYDALQLVGAEGDVEKMIKKLGEKVSLTQALQVYLGREDSRLRKDGCRHCEIPGHCPQKDE